VHKKYHLVSNPQIWEQIIKTAKLSSLSQLQGQLRWRRRYQQWMYFLVNFCQLAILARSNFIFNVATKWIFFSSPDSTPARKRYERTLKCFYFHTLKLSRWTI
jgi:hypothetical protein